MVLLLIYSAKKIWEAVRELPHFIYWIVMFVLDRNPGEYVLVDEAKRREEAKKQWEASPEYATLQKNLKIYEDFYNNGIVAPELYCLLGREEGYLEGAAEGFKSTYDVAFRQGRIKAIADAPSRTSSGSYSGGSGKKSRILTDAQESPSNIVINLRGEELRWQMFVQCAARTTGKLITIHGDYYSIG